MNDLAANAKKLGITINLTTHPFSTVVGTAVPCTPSQATCKWDGQNWGAGWIYGPCYLPTGEPLYNPGSAANAGSYVDPSGKMTSLITADDHRPPLQESRGADHVRQVRLDAGPGDLRTDLGRHLRR